LRITGLVRSMEENPRRPGLEEAFRPDLAIYSGGALDRDRDFFAPGFVDVLAVARSRVPAAFATLRGFAGVAADLPGLRFWPLVFFWRWAASSDTAWSSEKVSGSVALGKYAKSRS